MTSAPDHTPAHEWSVDELAGKSGAPVRTIREYQTLGLLHPPHRSGRIGLYNASHLGRLELIRRLQKRGYSLAGIADLLSAWRHGDAIGDVLGLAPDQLVHVDEPGSPASLDQLSQLIPALVPARLDDLVATGVVEACGADRFCVPSPSLLQLAVDALATGLAPSDTISLLEQIRTAVDLINDGVLNALAKIPPDTADEPVELLVGRGRGLLAHGLGRLSIHRLGRQLAIEDNASPTEVASAIRRHTRSRVRSTRRRPRRMGAR